MCPTFKLFSDCQFDHRVFSLQAFECSDQNNSPAQPWHWQKRAAGCCWMTTEEKTKKKEKEGKKERARFGQRESGSGFAHWRGSAWLLACLPGCLSVWVMWDWFILVHHLAHQSFTWDWVSKDDKSESLMWSKVSGSDSVWVNTKDLLFPFFFTPPHTHIHPQAPPSTPPPLSPAPSFCLLLSFPITRPPLTPFPEIYEGNVWIWLALWTRSQTTSETLCWGSRLHGDVFLLSLSLFLLFLHFFFFSSEGVASGHWLIGFSVFPCI